MESDFNCSGKSKEVVQVQSQRECQTLATAKLRPHLYYQWHAKKGKCLTSNRCQHLKPKRGWVVFEAPVLEENDFVVVVESRMSSQDDCVGNTYRVSESQREENKYFLVDDTGVCSQSYFGVEHLKFAQLPELSENDWVYVLAGRIPRQAKCVGNRYKIKSTRTSKNQYWLSDDLGSCGRSYFNRHDLKLANIIEMPELSVNDWVTVLAGTREQANCVGNHYKIEKAYRGNNQYKLVDDIGSCGSEYFTRHDLKFEDSVLVEKDVQTSDDKAM